MRTKDQISAYMRRVKSENTKPETILKEALLNAGIDFIDYKDHGEKLPGKPDILIPLHKLAIFVDGDLWHGNQWKIRGKVSLEDQFSNSENKTYWINKIQTNVIRDTKVTYDLLDTGWVVIRLWESQIEGNLDECINMILDYIQTNISNPIFARLPQKTVAEFFAGIGLMRMGLENRGWKVLFANDFDPNKIQMYQDQYPSSISEITVDDIHKLPVSTVPSVSLATASFPCNDLSLAGGRKGLNEGKQSSAFWGFVRILEELQDRKPPLILLENVVGFLSSKNGSDFLQALLTLNNLGYLVDSVILDAAYFVPQSRKRLFIIGMHRDLIRSSNWSNIILNSSNSRPEMLRNFIVNHPEVEWNIRSLPNQPFLTKNISDILDDIPDTSQEWWDEQRSQYLFDQMSDKHKEIANKMINGADWSFGTVFRRVRNGKSMAELRTDGIAGCLRTPRGGSGRQILFVAGKGIFKVRLLNPRECAKLMGADDFNITTNQNQALFGFGDAVCVPVIEWIVDQYLNPFVNEIIHEYPIAKTQTL